MENVIYQDNLKQKIIILVSSILLVALIFALYLSEKSINSWNGYEILSCVMVNVWAFFLIPALRKGYLNNKDKNFQEWFIMGMHYGISGICLPSLLSPYYGICYYFNLSVRI